MKKPLFIVLIGLLFSCKKGEMSTFESEISGTWELEKYVGFIRSTYPPDNGKIIVLGRNGTFERRQHDTVVFRGHYTLLKKNDCYQRSTNLIFSTNESTHSTYDYIELKDGKLTLSTPNCYQDGGTAYYRRVN